MNYQIMVRGDNIFLRLKTLAGTSAGTLAGTLAVTLAGTIPNRYYKIEALNKIPKLLELMSLSPSQRNLC